MNRFIGYPTETRQALFLLATTNGGHGIGSFQLTIAAFHFFSIAFTRELS